MKEISQVKEFSGERFHSALKEQISENAIEGKKKILEYLKSFPADSAAGMVLMDEITGTEIDTGVLGYEDGAYYWDTREVYHFEKYNLKLNQDFVEYVLTK